MSDDTSEPELEPKLEPEAEPEPDVELTPKPESEPKDHGAVYSAARFGCGGILLVLMAAATGMALVSGLGTWVARHKVSTVPSVTGLRVPSATARILAADLTTAPMGAFATADFEPDVAMRQDPPSATHVPPGTRVDLLVAVAPTPTVVPDVSMDTDVAAASVLEYALLRPVVYQQLSDSVPFGRVVAQMPRAGQRATTGQQVALFVSMGRGTGGAVVPSVLGKSLSEAATDVASVYLVALLFDAGPGTSLSGKVTDQLPAPGTRVPIGSGVPLITSSVVN
ncbi:MAG: PASTA domain-containing protein [Coriobacteriia bacterium]